MENSSVQAGWQPDYNELDKALLLAHANEDKAALVSLYTQAADAAEHHQDQNAARFYLTHAYVFALDSGHPVHAVLAQRLDTYHASLTP